MSFIGRETLYIPPNIQVLKYKNFIIAKGRVGILKKEIKIGLLVKKVKSRLYLIARNKGNTNAEFSKEWGTLRVSLWKMFFGVFTKYSMKLIFVGIAHRFNIADDILKMRFGFSHKICFQIPFDLSLSQADKRPPSIIIEHFDYMKLRTIASKLQVIKKPEPYKGKGICFEGQKISRKIGKRVKK